jgi:integrase
MKLDLTERAILRIPIPEKGPRDYPDNHIRQLVLTIRPTGSRSWTLRYRIGRGADRRQRRLTLGTWPELSTEEAREKALQARKLLAKGIDPVEYEAEQRRQEAEKRLAMLEWSFPKLAERFIHFQRKRGRRTWIAQARVLGFKVQPGSDEKPELIIIDGSLADRWCNRPVAEIERLDITAAVDELMDSDRPEAARTRLNLLKTFFAWCENANYISRSPADRYKLDLNRQGRDRVLSDDELRWLWKAAAAEPYPYGQFIQLLMLTGQRRNEVAGLPHSEIKGDVWELPAQRSKNKHAHKIPLSPAAAAVIASTPRNLCGWVFTSTHKGPVSGFSIMKKRIEERMAEIAGRGVQIPQWGLHDIRRSVATGMASIGILPAVIEKVLNHTGGQFSGVAGIYNRHDYLPEKREALERWADHLMKIVDGEAQQKPETSNVIAIKS